MQVDEDRPTNCRDSWRIGGIGATAGRVNEQRAIAALGILPIDGGTCGVQDVAGPGCTEDADLSVASAVDVGDDRSAVRAIADDRQQLKCQRRDFRRPAGPVGVVVWVFGRVGRSAAVQPPIREERIQAVIPARLVERAQSGRQRRIIRVHRLAVLFVDRRDDLRSAVPVDIADGRAHNDFRAVIDVIAERVGRTGVAGIPESIAVTVGLARVGRGVAVVLPRGGKRAASSSARSARRKRAAGIANAVTIVVGV